MSALKACADAKAPLAAFDLGYLVESYLEAEAAFRQPMTTAK